MISDTNVTAGTGVRTFGQMLDKAVTLASCIVIPILVASTVVWAVDRPPQQDLWISHSVTVDQGEVTKVPVGSPAMMSMPMKHGRYQIYIEDKGGHILYAYPVHLLADNERFDFQNLVIEVPSSLPRGSYDVVVRISYWFNPFKDGKTMVRISELNVQ